MWVTILAVGAAAVCHYSFAATPGSESSSSASDRGREDDGRNAEETVEPVELEEAGLQAYWRLKIRLSFREVIVRMYLLGENLYCLTSNGRLIALDPKRGLTRWEYQLPREKEIIYRPSHPALPVTLRVGVGKKRKEETFYAVIVNTMTQLIVLDRETGEEMRNEELPFPASCGGASDGKDFFVASVKGLYHALSLDKGVHLWAKRTNGAVRAPLVYYREYVYVAGEDHSLYVSKARPDGKKVWQWKLDGAVVAGFEVEDRGCFVPCEDGRIYAFNPFTGRQLWPAFVCRESLTTAVQVGSKALFQYAKGDNFYAVNIANGAELWSMRDGRLVLAVIKGDVYLLDKDGNVRIVDEARGTLKAVVSLSGLMTFAPNVQQPAIYGASESGWVICIKPLSEGHVKPGMYEDKD
jgi:outer membrane protein assembly factor BamB